MNQETRATAAWTAAKANSLGHGKSIGTPLDFYATYTAGYVVPRGQPAPRKMLDYPLLLTAGWIASGALA